MLRPLSFHSKSIAVVDQKSACFSPVTVFVVAALEETSNRMVQRK